MSGRITSVEGSRTNRFGVPLEKVLQFERENHERLLAAHQRALKAWQKVQEARAKGRPADYVKGLERLAASLTEKALG